MGDAGRAQSHGLQHRRGGLEGHLFLKQNLNYKPTSGFAIDPFGHSSVVARVAAEAGLEHLGTT